MVRTDERNACARRLALLAAAVVCSLQVACASTPEAAPATGPFDLLVIDLESAPDDEQQAKLLTGMVVENAGRVPGVTVVARSELSTALNVKSQRALLGADDASLAAEARALGHRYVLGGRVGALGDLSLLQLFVLDATEAKVIARDSQRQTGDLSSLAAASSEVVERLISSARSNAAAAKGARRSVSDVIRTTAGLLNFCYEQELARSPGLEGSLMVRFEIGEDGHAATLTFDEAQSDISSATMRSCVQATASVWLFPSNLAGATIKNRFVFAPNDDRTNAIRAGSPAPATSSGSPSETVSGTALGTASDARKP